MNAMRFRVVTGFVLVFALTTSVRADDPKTALERKDLDARINAALRDVIDLGAKVYNGGDEEGCYRLYQGALTTTLPLMDHRPDLQKAARQKLAKAGNIPSSSEKAFALREVIDDIRAATRAPLWDRLGGETGVRAVVKDAMKLAADDPKVNFSRGGKFKPDEAAAKKNEQLLVEFLSSQTGGPLKYNGRDMKTVHKGMGITNAEFDALGNIIVKVMKDHKVLDREIGEVVAIVVKLREPIVETPLWERLGGDAAVRKVIHDFIAEAAKDPKVNVDRGGKYKLDAPKLEKLLVEFVSQNTGGPLKYSGKEMKPVHAGMMITEDEFKALAGHLVATLKKYNVPEKEISELVAVVATTKKDIVEKK